MCKLNIALLKLLHMIIYTPLPKSLINPSSMQKIIPSLWFDKQAEEAVNFYISVFKNSRITNVRRYIEGGPKPKGSVMAVTFELEGQAFVAINGGPHHPFDLYYPFTPAISFVVACKTQEELDELWHRLSQGGKVIQSGWLQDKYGISWQIIPSILGDLLDDPNPAKSRKVMKAMLKMDKIDIEGLKKAYAD
jgi:predicted 3-demethylubiquinone-9 3-methyltransferase (glyoxalase superfamily)